MDEEYDVIVLGTGLTECILSGLLSIDGKKVLHIDRNDYYGADSASLNLSQLFAMFREGEKPPESLGRDRDWCVDLVPKFLMANGDLTNILVYTDVTRYIEFKQIAGSYVYRDGRIAKVPSNEMEALKSPLMSLFEKRRAKRFLQWVANYRDDDPSTQKDINLDRDSMETVYTKFGLQSGTQDFIGHAMALHLDDSYIKKPARETRDRIMLYASSMAKFGKSPYIYPLYGLGELPQGFARLSAIYGGTYMLNQPIDEIVYDDNGVAIGVRSGEQVAKAKQILGDPSYFREKVRCIGRLVRAICILDHPIPNTDNLDSVQIIIPQKQVKRKHDIYIAGISSVHNICPKGYYLAIISTIAETANPLAEIAPGLKLLGPVLESFSRVQELYEPMADGTKDQCYISKSVDATSHFETLTLDVRDLYKRMTGHDLVLKQRPKQENM
ncbi:GDP dissociation inhibitor Gdi1 [Schizosaccharomyces japonicus yFS275]|uniref:Rab GDP dissociation inhibitor n=1 Tax=Schizosaccharomyces japonicus (strain yFS275 / FY16936) TaxID=402676 RepID=B6K2F4_SCHJY|nr:GDP dissociation inhibitor Gdi1 [Schizosaccharomyces japonicus yFS275]EEB07335.1 GDP dissociation inhibitor Gdi1 [Schizosaccharomyces japonicus yFS275]